MAGAGKGEPPLYIAAYILFAIGTAGLVILLALQPASAKFQGLLYIFLGFMAFGTGEILNHRQAPRITSAGKDNPELPRFPRKRNSCSLGNLCDIGALLLFFVGLSALLFPE
jgi:hypothetical protein